MKRFFLSICLLLSVGVMFAQQTASTKTAEENTEGAVEMPAAFLEEITPEQVNQFRDTLNLLVREFEVHLSNINDKQKSRNFRFDQVQLATQLFADDVRTVEVVTPRGELFQRPLREYLMRLNAIPVESLEVETCQVALLSNFKTSGVDNYKAIAYCFELPEQVSEISQVLEQVQKVELLLSREEYERLGAKNKEFVTRLGNLKVAHY